MAVSDASAVPALDKTGSNLWKWEAAYLLYAQANGYDGLLTGSWTEPDVHTPDYLDLPDTYGTSTIPTQADLDAAISRVREHNEYQYRLEQRQLADHQKWKAANAALQLAILNTVPKELY